MWRRHSIAARKASGDAAKSRIYSIIWKKIQMAAKNGADPKMNPALEMILEKARYNWLPRDVIDRAILKGSWQLEWEDMKEVIYEGYGPNGSAFLIKTITSNTNRTSSDMKTILTKWWWAMAEMWAVARQFQEKGLIVIDWLSEKYEDKWRQLEKVTPFNNEQIEMDMIELPISDISIEDWIAEVYTTKTEFLIVKKQVEELWYHITEADLHYFADNIITLEWHDLEVFNRLLDTLNDNDDVDHVYHNVNL